MNIIYHLIYDIYNKDYDIEVYIFFCILSIFEINKSDLIDFKIYFHYSYLPNQNGKLWNIIKNKLNDKLVLKKIKCNEITNEIKNNNVDFKVDFKLEFIKKILNEYGGIYIKNNCLLLKKINLKNSIKKIINDNNINDNNINDNNMNDNNMNDNNMNDNNMNDNKLVETPCMIYLNTISSDLKYINYFRTDDTNILFKEIFDYTFSTYFYILKNSDIIYFDMDYSDLKNINMYDVFNKTTIYNLLIRHVITYSYMMYDKINNKINLNMLNNIDIILWINLKNSKKRSLNMTQILSNFDIPNQRIEAINGSIEDDISYNYFECINKLEYPKYSNKEYAILATHLKAIETYANIPRDLVKYGIGLICEDDLSLDFSKYWKSDIKSIIENAPEDWEIIMLGYFSLNLNRTNDMSIWCNEWSAISYLVRYEKLDNKILSLKAPNNLNKWICETNDLMVSDNYIFSKFKTYVYKYPYFTFPNDNDSTFHEDHLNYHQIYKQSNYITLEGLYDEFV